MQAGYLTAVGVESGMGFLRGSEKLGSAHFGLANHFGCREFEKELAGVRIGGGTHGRAVVDDPIGAGGKESGVGSGGADGEDAGTGGFSGTSAGGRVFDDDAGLRMEIQRSGAFQIGLGIGLAMLDVAGGDHVAHMIPKPRSAKTNFRERARGGSNHNELRWRYGGEKFLCTREGHDALDIFDFRAFHPIVFGEVGSVIGVRKEFLYGGEAGAAVGEVDGVIGVQIVLDGPAGPDASDGGSGVDEDAVHVEEEALAGDLGHRDSSL
jgi:hypothetical protein